MIRLSPLKKFCEFSLQAALLAVWFPLLAVLGQPLFDGLNSTQFKHATEIAAWPLESLQAEPETGSEGGDESTNTTLKVFVATTAAPSVPSTITPFAFQIRPRCLVRRAGSAISAERAPPNSHR